MTLSNEDEIKIRAYLVGGLREAEELELEQRLLVDHDLAQHLLLVEEELIEDYERGALDASELERFETFFLVTPRRRRKLRMVKAARRYAAAVPAAAVGPRADGAHRRWWQRLLHTLFIPRWKIAAFACVVAAVVIFGVWRARVGRESPVDAGLVALNEAYASRRPVEARVTGMGHAPFVAARGTEQQEVDYRARDRAAALLLEAVHQNPTPSALHALGQSYLMRQEFDHAIQQFEEGLKAAPDDAKLHADLGAALFEQGKLERLNERSGQSEVTLAKSLQHLTRALTLDESLPEARFNRALLYEALKLPERAREDWEQYLSRDSDPRSPWAIEARRHLDQLQEQRGQSSRREENLFRECLEAYRGGDEERAWQNFSRGHYRTGNFVAGRIVDDYLRLMDEGRSGEVCANCFVLLGRSVSVSVEPGEEGIKQFGVELVAHINEGACRNSSCAPSLRGQVLGEAASPASKGLNPSLTLHQRYTTLRKSVPSALPTPTAWMSAEVCSEPVLII